MIPGEVVILEEPPGLTKEMEAAFRQRMESAYGPRVMVVPHGYKRVSHGDVVDLAPTLERIASALGGIHKELALARHNPRTGQR
jgi:hypothetical protein